MKVNVKKQIRRKNDVKIAKKRKKLWELFGWTRGKLFAERTQDGNYSLVGNEKGFVGYFRNNHSTNCGCSFCRNHTFFKKYANKKNRRLVKQKLFNINGSYSFEDNCNIIKDKDNLTSKVERLW